MSRVLKTLKNSINSKVIDNHDMVTNMILNELEEEPDCDRDIDKRILDMTKFMTEIYSTRCSFDLMSLN